MSTEPFCGSPSGTTGDQPAVLVVDDASITRHLIGEMLRREGFSVVEAADGRQGLELARQLRPLAIVLDVMMPEMDGWTVLQHLKSSPELASIPVIMATVLQEESKGYVLGATNFLTKPIDRPALIALLNKCALDRQSGPILVVEDDDGTRDITTWVLEHEGWQVREAANGREALDQVAAQRPQLILLDLIMPEMDGFEFVDQLYKTPAWRSIPIVVVTAHELTPAEGQYLNERVTRVLHKGTHSRDEFLQTICSLVHHSLER